MGTICIFIQKSMPNSSIFISNKLSYFQKNPAISQPSCALVSFCRLNSIPFKEHIINIFQGEHLKPDFAKINPKQKVPCIQEVDVKTGDVLLTLSESHAILRYLATTRNVPEHQYPRKDLRQQARIDECLDRHHTWLRQGAEGLVYKKLITPMLLGKKPTKKELQFHEIMLVKSLRQMERQLGTRKYLCGDEISVVDLAQAHELDTVKFLDYDLSKWPKVQAWLRRVLDEDPVNSEVSKVRRDFATAFRKRANL